MKFKAIYRQIAITILLSSLAMGCRSTQPEITPSPTPVTPTAPAATVTPEQTPSLADYAFPDTFDPAKKYMFYVHGKIIEDQGIPAVSPEFGEYEYLNILEKLSSYGFVVISEQRPPNPDSVVYAKRVVEQVTTLLNAGVPAQNITVVGASKGAAITVYVSHLLENKELNFVLLAICHPDLVKAFEQGGISLYGNVLSIYDYKDDEFAGSCQELFSFSEGKGISRYNEIVVHIGTGHGILYKPLNAWILPTVEWTGKP